MRATTGFSLSFAVSLTTLLTACGGGGGGYGGGGGGNPADPSGAYYGSGTYADAAGNDTLMLVKSDNSFWIFYTPPNNTSAVTFVESGNASTVTSQTFDGGSVTDYAMLYADPTNSNAILPTSATAGAVTTGLTVSMDYTYQAQIDGSILQGATINSSLVPLFITGSKSTASLATVAGSYSGNFSSTLNTSTLNGNGCFFTTALTVGSNGMITGTVDDCSGANFATTKSTVTGSLTARTDIAAYDVTLTFTDDSPDSNPLDGASSTTYTGIAYLLASNNTLYIAGISSGGDAVAFAGIP